MMRTLRVTLAPPLKKCWLGGKQFEKEVEVPKDPFRSVMKILQNQSLKIIAI